jgi:DNA-binding transcriptional LysR family regulator
MQGGRYLRLAVCIRFEQHIYAIRMSDRLQELAIFVRAAETGSFSRAARELGTSQPSISRTIAALEARLGVKVFLRTTRRVTLTDAGSVLLERARDILSEIDEAEDAARGTDSLRGLLKLAMPVAFGIREVIPRLPAFLLGHPQLRVDFGMADEAEDLVAEGVDMALRLGVLADSGFGARKLASAPRMVLASPGYVRARGAPTTLDELAQHDCIFGPGASGRKGWIFRESGPKRPMTGIERFNVGSAEGVIALAKAGLGVAVASLWMCRAELAAGDLVQILPGFSLDHVDVHAIFPADGNLPGR